MSVMVQMGCLLVSDLALVLVGVVKAVVEFLEEVVVLVF